MIPPLPARHVHLDFHTSEHVREVGARFDKKRFQKALQLGRVNYITLFAKCHHSWCYFPTQVGRRHPHLVKELDLLGQQIEACHEIGVRTAVYITVGWSANDAEWHPEWVALDRAGKAMWMNPPKDLKPDTPRPQVSWKFLCIASAYRQHVLDLTREVCSRYPLHGVFYDIMFHERSFSKAAVRQMRAAGVDLDDAAATKRWHEGQWVSFMRECKSAIAETRPQATVFFNGRANLDSADASLTEQTHLELEDLPTVWGGYDKFQPRAKFFASHPVTADKQMMAMSGKFHTAWGEFGGFKHPDAIRYEAANMIAWGARCSFGDQLHPNGEMDLATYRNIGEAYAHVEKVEGYGLDGVPAANLGVWFSCLERTDASTPVAGVVGGMQKLDHDYGVTQMLLESQIDFEAAGADSDLGRYATIVVSGAQCLDRAQAARLTAWARRGGALVVIGESALDAKRRRFLIDVGATYVGPGRFDCDYTVAGAALADGLPTSPFLNYDRALRCRPGRSAEVLAEIREPSFSRTVATYCSHQNTAYGEATAKHPAVISRKLGKGSITWFAHPIGATYYYHGARVHRQLFVNAIRRVHTKPVLETALLSAGRANVVHQPQHRRYCVHLTYGSPQARGRTSVIEDLPTLTGIPVGLRVSERIRSVRLAVAGKTLAVKRSAGAVRVTVPSLNCHEVAVFSY
ncbi:MAG TPA: hypothetical protein DCS97_06590 [Planctomycetes bacterium]|nr:hypothetical protein [Planctomycetota bacterium]